MAVDMKGASRQALTALRGVAGNPSADEAGKISQDLFNAIQVLDSSLPLRRALTDPTRDGASKTSLVDDLFAKTLASQSIAIIKSGVSERWSNPADLPTALEVVAIEIEAGAVVGIDVELMGIAHALSGAKELSGALMGGRAIDSLISDLFSTKVSAATLRIALAIARHLRGRHFITALDTSGNWLATYSIAASTSNLSSTPLVNSPSLLPCSLAVPRVLKRKTAISASAGSLNAALR